MKLMHCKGYILLDENIPFDFIFLFEYFGYNVEHLKKIGKVGIKNGEVYKYAENDKRWIVTRDADFQSFFKFMKYNIGGVILIKTSLTHKAYLFKIMTKFLNDHGEKLTTKLLITIEDERITFLK